MHFAFFRFDDNGIPVERKSPVFENADVANAWVEHAVDSGETVSDDNMHIHTCNKDGTPVTEVPPEEAAKASEEAGRLVREHKEIAMAVEAMISARQLYAVGLIELERLLEQHAAPSLRDTVREFMSQSASHVADKPFDHKTLVTHLTKAVIPWVTDTGEGREAEDRKDRERRHTQWDARRREVQLPLGFEVVLRREGEEAKKTSQLPREHPLVMVGSATDRDAVFARIIEATIRHEADDSSMDPVVVRLTAGGHGQNNARLHPMPLIQWENACRSAESFYEVMLPFLKDEVGRVPDLLVVEDLSRLKPNTTDREPGSHAADTFKRVHDWCRKVGCGLVAAVPLDDQARLDHHQWLRIKEYATLLELRPALASATDETPGINLVDGSKVVGEVPGRGTVVGLP